MNGLHMRRPSGCQEIFRMAVQQAHAPPIPRPPEISINELNGHVRFTKTGLWKLNYVMCIFLKSEHCIII